MWGGEKKRCRRRRWGEKQERREKERRKKEATKEGRREGRIFRRCVCVRVCV